MRATILMVLCSLILGLASGLLRWPVATAQTGGMGPGQMGQQRAACRCPMTDMMGGGGWGIAGMILGALVLAALVALTVYLFLLLLVPSMALLSTRFHR